MLNDLRQVLIELKNKFFSSRIFILGCLYGLLVLALYSRLFKLQILRGEYYQNNYVQKTEKKLSLPATRGNIYDRNGELLAYNKLAYAVTLRDNGDYKRYQDRNSMIYRLVKILHEHEEKVIGDFEVALDENGNYYYTSSSEAAKKRFLRNLYGLKSVEDLDDKEGKYPSDITAAELVEKKFKDYKLQEVYDREGKPVTLSAKEKLDIINIRYTMGFTAYHKYDATKVSSDIKEETKAALLENAAVLLGVNIEEESLRVYNDSIYFSSIIGYTGKIQESQLEELQAKNPDYTENDIVGRIGIEEYMDIELQGKKGHQLINVDNVGHILEIKEEVEPVPGKDVYLTVDRTLQIGTYNLLEQQLAGILSMKIVNEDNPNTDKTNATDRRIPVKDAYYQLISNNVLSVENFKKESASSIEKEIYNKYYAYYERSMERIRVELENPSAAQMKDLPEDVNAFLVYVYNALSSDEHGVIMKDMVDTTSPEYGAWKADTISLRAYLQYLSANNWIDSSKLNVDNKYLAADDIYSSLLEYIAEMLATDSGFEKLLYKYLVKNGVVTGRELCISLYEQKVLKYDDNSYQLLYSGGETYAFSFLIEKISNLEITPAQLALEPSTASAVITDVNTGEVLALVSYPGYDNNRLSNTMDAAYYNRLLQDQSLPLYNNATQTRKAPGSTFKPIAAIAGLEEGVVDQYEKIDCTGEYDLIFPTIKCWTYPAFHGPLDVRDSIQNSCNYYFAEIGHRLSLKENGEYSPSYGLERLGKYARMFGLNTKSGVEIAENDPMITDRAPEQSSIGQGSNSYANVQLSRYVSALANKGTIFNLSILDKLVDKDGNLVQDFTPVAASKVELADSTWNSVREGMFRVIRDGSASNIFKDLQVEIAGKTGTAQESKNRANHAYFLSFAPYSNPEIAVTVNIPYGYSSSNAATAAKNIYKLYFGYTNLDIIMNSSALDVTTVKIGD